MGLFLLELEAEDLQRSVETLKGVGPKRAAQLAAMGLRTWEDLLWHFPHRYEDWTPCHPEAVMQKEQAVLRGHILSIDPLRLGVPSVRITARGEDGTWTARVFGHRWLERSLHLGQEVFVRGSWQPTVEGPTCTGGQLETTGPAGWVPIYPATEHIKSSFLHRLIAQVLEIHPLQVPGGSTHVPGPEGYVALAVAIDAIHRPTDAEDVRSARESVALLELLVFRMVMERVHRTRGRGLAQRAPDRLLTGLIEELPFALTDDQQKAWARIAPEMEKSAPMLHLLQGDVATGKTVVAALASAKALDNSGRVVWLVPTQVLAEQHYHTLRGWFDPLGIEVALLTGDQASSWESARLIVGTHALLGQQEALADLSLVVIDEQQRFGVSQRGMLQRMDPVPDVLSITATPIPRTLARALWGGMTLSSLRESPHGCRKVRTRVVSTGQRADVYRQVKRALAQKWGVVVICPTIQAEDRTNVRDWIRRLQIAFPTARLAAIHGQLPSDERRQILDEFRAGTIDLLVGTSVLQVGLDVPRARMMVVEEAERFGFSELHQLRGRIGRDGHPSLCYFVLSASADGERYQIFEAAADGFTIAEQDLAQRGMGDFFSSRQHGSPVFRVFSHHEHAHLYPRLALGLNDSLGGGGVEDYVARQVERVLQRGEEWLHVI